MRHSSHHRHAARRLYKRDDPLITNMDVVEIENSLDLDRRADDVATVFSVVYVTASATFSGPTAGFVTLGADPTTTTPKAAKTATSNNNNDNDKTTSTKAKHTSTTEKPNSSPARTSAKSAAASSSANVKSTATGVASASSSSSLSTPSSGLLTASAAASSTIASSAIASSAAKAQVTSSSSASASASPEASSGGMSTGAKAGIALLVICIIGVAVGLALFMIRKKKAQQKAAGGAEKLDDEKAGFISKSPSTMTIPQPPPLSHNNPAPRVSYRPGSAFAPGVVSDAEKAAAGAATAAAAGAVVSQSAGAHGRKGSQATNDPSNPFGIHAQTIDTQSKEMISPIPEERSLSPPVELQGSPVPSPTAASFNINSPATPSADARAEVGMAAAVSLPAVAAATPGAAAADPPGSTVHRVQLEFKPSMDDELELKVGQIVRVLHEYDDGWALCIRMDRSQQGVAPRTCLSKLPLKPRPMGPPPGVKIGPPPGPKNGPPRGAPRPGQGPNGPPRPGPGPQARQLAPSPKNPSAAKPVRPAAQPSWPSSPTVATKAAVGSQDGQPRQRSMSVSSPTKSSRRPQQDAASPAEKGLEAHSRSASMGTMGSANKSSAGSVEPSILGVPARKPVPGQAL